MSKKFWIKETHQYGKGVFARKKIQKGATVTLLTGKVFTGMKYEKGFHEGDARTWIQIDKLRWLKSKLGSYLNHSCDPNAGIFGRKLVALRNISEDEEITFDYDTHDWNEWGLYLHCKCRSQNCRKVIRGYKYLSASLKKKYQQLSLIPNFLIRLDNREKLGG